MVECGFIIFKSSLVRAWIVRIKSPFFKHSSLVCFFKPAWTNSSSLTLIPWPTSSSNQISAPRSIKVRTVSIWSGDLLSRSLLDLSAVIITIKIVNLCSEVNNNSSNKSIKLKNSVQMFFLDGPSCSLTTKYSILIYS